MALKSKVSGGAGADWADLPSAAASMAALQSRGIFMDIVGLEGGGKSSLALTLARLGKLAYIDIDQSVDRARKPDSKKERENIKVLPVRYLTAMGMSEAQVQAIAAPAWANMGTKLDSAVSTWARGAVIDTGSETWELARLSAAGTLNPHGKRMDRVYGPINAKMRQLFRSVNRTHCKHLVTIHMLKDEYQDKINSSGEQVSIKTGKHVRAGFKEVGYLCDVVVRCFREKGEFKGEILLNKLPPAGPSLEGMELEGEQLDFSYIVGLSTETEPEEWLK